MRAVAPVVRQPSCCHRGQNILLIEGHHGKKLDVGNAESFQVGIFSIRPAEVPGCLHTARPVAGKAANVQFMR